MDAKESLREVARQDLTRAVNALETAVQGQAFRHEVRRLSSVLRSRLENLTALDDEVLREIFSEIEDEDLLDEEYQTTCFYNDVAIIALCDADEYLSDMSSKTNSSSISSSTSSQTSTSTAARQTMSPPPPATNPMQVIVEDEYSDPVDVRRRKSNEEANADDEEATGAETRVYCEPYDSKSCGDQRKDRDSAISRDSEQLTPTNSAGSARSACSRSNAMESPANAVQSSGRLSSTAKSFNSSDSRTLSDSPAAFVCAPSGGSRLPPFSASDAASSCSSCASAFAALSASDGAVSGGDGGGVMGPGPGSGSAGSSPAVPTPASCRRRRQRSCSLGQSPSPGPLASPTASRRARAFVRTFVRPSASVAFL